MNKRLFAQLMKSLRQDEAILRGTAAPSRRSEVTLIASAMAEEINTLPLAHKALDEAKQTTPNSRVV